MSDVGENVVEKHDAGIAKECVFVSWTTNGRRHERFREGENLQLLQDRLRGRLLTGSSDR